MAALFVFSDPELKAQSSPAFEKSDLIWATERLDTGIYWKNYRGEYFFDSKQNVNLIEVYLDSVDMPLKVAFHEDSLFKTSQFASSNDALAAINGSFFNREEGGSVVFLKVDGKVIHEGHTNRNPFNERGAVGWSDKEPVQILKRPEEGWKTLPFKTILTSGPLLIYDSEAQTFNNNSFHQNRHPRTAVAISNDKRLFLVTIDGLSFQAYGMTIPELTSFLRQLGSDYALNLDGGGSTSMWIRKRNDNGIVNYPSDNFQFDHKGERDVANALLILSSDK
ncbi:MAG: phosphodiester glycosidase family protein [Balneolaceae bacterium]|nr:phosphodiester glycosidase family protein [Balneolaceae bacterium]